MRCPNCQVDNDRVIDTRASEDRMTIRRRRECLKCGRRYTTYERYEPTILKVGTLALDLKEGRTGKLAWRGKIEGVLTGDHAAQLETVDKAIAAHFEKYPGNKAPGK